ncbi:MAG: hypothetical protein MZV70_76050 [Desulfobacterales bacterium]|nr:hypothetical protein [Desulfobacterales bacterium]
MSASTNAEGFIILFITSQEAGGRDDEKECCGADASGCLRHSDGTAFSETVTFTCRYDSYSNEKGFQKVQDDFRLVFAVDTEKETAQTLTDKGKFNVDMLPSPSGGMTFVEMVDGGKVLATSIDLNGKSVHSRNIILEGRMSHVPVLRDVLKAVNRPHPR